MPENNIWSFDYLNDPLTPFVQAFGAFRPQRTAGSTQPQTFFDYFRGRQNQVETQYQEALGQQAASGQAPTLERTDFLQNFPWMQRYYQLSRSQRGVREAPFVRFIPNR